ncbi:Molybdenum ABC transporter ATP-binding protein ModC [Citrifermentans bremense]|uniref:Molybdenum ABC transporter ATP-binding protein ModC n=1 Tax=Citrifermentans bremense TaxID=60035 RepID=A0A6S6M4N5_9BACT|nr:molybdenum ABC transporter ATP-binding protein [Citrifermentans bremense]BCG46896.1 Molybdenum ABC transporter ATP-binding protein ModC [Citrifermentans bremense]
MEIRIAVEKQLGSFSLQADVTMAGERIGIFGASGSGKSTLVGLLAGLHQPDRGEISVDGHCFFSSSKTIDVPPEQRRIAIVFQQHCLFPHLDVKANLLYGYRRSKPEHRSIDFETLVEVLNLRELLSRGINNLSGGEKQRVALGRALLSNPRLLLMDEPLSALDDTLRFQIIPYLKRVSEQMRIPYLFISHSLVETRLMAEQVVVVSGGAIVAQTTSEQLARSRMDESPVGYINLLKLTRRRKANDLYAYSWGADELLISAGSDQPEALFELSSKDIILCKKHPEVISARNLLKCNVINTFNSGNKVGVELASGDGRLVAEVVNQAADELDIGVGSELYVAIKASAFRRRG